MTPQEKAMAQILQVSLFKLADEFHDTLARLRKTHPQAHNRIDQISRDVEAMVDRTLEDFMTKGREFSIKDVEKIHSEIIEVRRLLG